MSSTSLWDHFQKYLLRYDDLGFSLDISRMRFADDFFEKMQPRAELALARMKELEAGAIANPDEGRMVGHYWLRAPQLAPNDELRGEIERTLADINKFAAAVHCGTITAGVLHVTQAGTFERGASVLQLRDRPVVLRDAEVAEPTT